MRNIFRVRYVLAMSFVFVAMTAPATAYAAEGLPTGSTATAPVSVGTSPVMRPKGDGSGDERAKRKDGKQRWERCPNKHCQKLRRK